MVTKKQHNHTEMHEVNLTNIAVMIINLSKEKVGNNAQFIFQ